jgi:ribosomal protein L11 methyltransferase
VNSGSLLRIALRCPASAVPAFEAVLARCCFSVSFSFDVARLPLPSREREGPIAGRWEGEGATRDPGPVMAADLNVLVPSPLPSPAGGEGDAGVLEGIACAPPDRSALAIALAIAAASAGVPPPEVTIEELPDRDWLAENRERFAPFRIGRFVIQEPDDRTPTPAGAIPLRIEAALAFGSGRHGSTAGCLKALELLARRPIRRVLDVGCGSGILAVAAAKLWRVPVLATDLDPRAVAVARDNVRLNGAGHLVRVVLADDYRSPAIKAGAPFDLVLCNILAGPLKRLARELARYVRPGGGIAVLAGLLARDGNDVLAAHRAARFTLLRARDYDGWRTLVVQRGRQPAAAISGVR